MNSIVHLHRMSLLKRALLSLSRPKHRDFTSLSRSSKQSFLCDKNVLMVKHHENNVCLQFGQKFDFSSSARSAKFNFTWKSFFISGALVAVFAGFMLFMKQEKMKQMERQRRKGIGQASLGGKFELIDQDGKPFGSQNLMGSWALIYFGFTHCPDVCPDELEKIVEAVEMIEANKKADPIKPVFITVDPERDDVQAVREYIREFSPKFIGLTGNKEQVDQATKAYRVYFSAGPRDNVNDYIVDHTIITYLVDPEGNMVDYYGQTKTAADVYNGVIKSMDKYRSLNRRLGFI